MLNFDKYINKVNEGLIKTYDIDFVIEKSFIPFDCKK